MSASHRLKTIESEERKVVNFSFNDQTLEGFDGEPIAAALLANNIVSIRTDEKTDEPRGIYCGIGHCYECRATVDGRSSIRTCLTPVREGTRVVSNRSELEKNLVSFRDREEGMDDDQS